MKKKELVSLILASVMLFSATAGVSGCHAKSGNGVSKAIRNKQEEVLKDSVWFDYSSKDIEVPDVDKYYYSCFTSVDATKDGFAATFTGYVNGYSADESHIFEYDKDLNLINDTVISKDMFNLEDGVEVNLRGSVIADGEVYATVGTYLFDGKSYEYNPDTYFYNVTKKEIVDTSYLKSEIDPDNSFVQSLGVTDNGTIYMIVYNYGANHGYQIVFGKDGKYLKTIEVTKLPLAEDIIEVFYESSNGSEVAFSCTSDGNKEIVIDTSDWSAEVIENPLNNHYYTFTGENGEVYYIEDDGIYSEDELVMPFAATFANSRKIAEGQLIEADGEHFVVEYIEYEGDTAGATIYTFDKAESNPNVGKKIITVGSIGSSSGAIPEAISLFNQNSSDYFVTSMVYDVTDEGFDFTGDYTDDDYMKYRAKQTSNASDELIIDLMNGEGPDILIDTANMSQLNSEEYLYDISEILDEIDAVELYDNVIDASRTDGKLYQIPLSFDVAGIYALKKNVKGEEGFTFDEYVTYVDEVCNGKNPMKYMGRSDVLQYLLNSMSDEFFDEDGNVFFSNETFYNLSNYCLNNVPERNPWRDMIDDELFYEGDESVFDSDGLEFTKIHGLNSYLTISQSFKDEVGFYGMPSNDGRGPSIEVKNSIAISAACSDYEGAKQFVEFFFGKGTQSIWDELTTNPIMVEANNAICKRIVDKNNRNFDMQISSGAMTEAQLNSYNVFRIDDSIIDDYNRILRSGSSLLSMDPSIYIIVVEELPSYFAGQKKIEDVSAIIEDRAQTVIDER